MRGMRNLLFCLPAFLAGDPWTKVRDLKSGTEFRIYRRNIAAPKTQDQTTKP